MQRQIPSARSASREPGSPESTGRFFPVAERFVSINGEGPRAGRLAAFVRFRGCNLSCSYCDTAWANRADCPVERLSARQIVQFARDAGTRHLTLTGGEPLLQPDLDLLIGELLAVPGLSVEIETNGALPLDPLAQLRSRIPAAQRSRLSFTLDCKLPSSGMADRMRAENYRLLMPHDTVKFVIGNEGDFTAALKVIADHGLTGRCLVYLSPVYGQMEPAAIVDLMRANGLVDATLQLQLHKIIWPDAQKGV